MELDAPVFIERVEVHNREDEFAYRAWSAVLETSTDNLDWDLVFDHREREQRFLELARSLSIGGLPAASAPSVAEVILAALRSPAELTDRLDRLKHEFAPELRNVVARTLNADFMAGMGVEITTHGLTKTFRFWTDRDKDEYLFSATRIIKALDAGNHASFVSFGTLLGIVRDGDFIPHDDDIDISVVVEAVSDDDLKGKMLVVRSSLQSAGLNCYGDHDFHFHAAFGEAKPVDLFFMRRTGDSCFVRPARSARVGLGQVFPLGKTTFRGVEVPVPADALGFLRHVYGDDWRTPRPSFEHTGW
ncbi:LicD family protein [Micromonospora sp. STR1s_5]|nr:LicD family protein [Micromonospora sp. STR1s_5]